MVFYTKYEILEILEGHVLDFSSNIEVYEDLRNFNSQKVIAETFYI